MSKCARCKVNEATIIHSRRYRKRTDDYYEVKYCRACQRERVNTWYRTRDYTPKKLILGSNEALIRKYANVSQI